MNSQNKKNSSNQLISIKPIFRTALSSPSNSFKKEYKPLFVKETKNSYYSSLVKSIYKENKTLKEINKLSFSKNTDPILHNIFDDKYTNKNLAANSKSRVPLWDRNSNLPTASTNTRQELNKSVDYLRTSYNIFYEYDGESNLNMSKELTRSKKSCKKMCASKNNHSLLEDDSSFTYYKTKKIYKNRNSVGMSQDFMNPNKFQKNVFREHVTTSYGGVVPSKKHYSNNLMQSSNYITKIHDKQTLLPSEFSQKYKSNNSFSGNNNDNPISAYNDNFHMSKLGITTKQESSQKFKPHFRKANYPYVKDNVKALLKNNVNSMISKEIQYKLPEKVNKNPYDILRRVPKYQWEI